MRTGGGACYTRADQQTGAADPYVEEPETFILPLLTKLKHDAPEYSDLTFLVKYQILSLLETVKNMME